VKVDECIKEDAGKKKGRKKQVDRKKIVCIMDGLS
jgi:hypothetical protein